MAKKIRVGIIGGAGYTGGELLRLLLHHPNIDIVFVHSHSQKGKPVVAIHDDLVGETHHIFTEDFSQASEVIFLCLAHHESRSFLENNPISDTTRIIDLSQDFRVDNTFGTRQFTYGLPELYKQKITQATNIANPGCFATALQLSILPASLQLGVKDFFVTGITGSTGAGQKLQASSHFSWRSNNIQAYKTLQHQHLNEITHHLKAFSAQVPNIKFIPWRGNFSRGIFISSYFHTKKAELLSKMYKDFYSQHPFVYLSDLPIHLKQAMNTNKCILQVEQVENDVVVHACIDNLLKGASGQAVQNFNLMYGLPETEGLMLKPIAF